MRRSWLDSLGLELTAGSDSVAWDSAVESDSAVLVFVGDLVLEDRGWRPLPSSINYGSINYSISVIAGCFYLLLY